MSIHVSPSAEEHASFHRTEGLALAMVCPKATPYAPSAQRMASPDVPASVGSALAAHLPHMGLVLAISAPKDAAERFVEGTANAMADGVTVRIEAGGDCPIRLASPPTAGPGRYMDLTGYTVFGQLSQALDAMTGDDTGGLHANALRLALVARGLIVEGRPAQVPQQSPWPDTKPADNRSGLVKWRLKRVTSFIEEHLCEAITLADMARAAGLSRMHFAAQFRISTGVRPHEYLLRSRIERAQKLMRETREPLVQIALGVGFQTQAHFTTVFRRFAGTTPYQWRCSNVAPA